MPPLRLTPSQARDLGLTRPRSGKRRRADPSGRAADRLPEPTEDQVQRVIVDGLLARGYTVQITSRRRKRCRSCGTVPTGGDGATKGIADLLLRGRDWPRGTWLAAEVKRPGPVRYTSKEQRRLAETGGIVIVQSLEDALRALEGFAP